MAHSDAETTPAQLVIQAMPVPAALFDAFGECVAVSGVAPLLQGDPEVERLVEAALGGVPSRQGVEWSEDGGPRRWRLRAVPVEDADGEILGALVVGEDITEVAFLAAELGRDALTGLRNRRAFDDELAHEVDLAARHNRAMSLIAIDIDDFKVINDTFGHPVGDRVLRDVGATLIETLRHTDVLARIGGDEFLALLPETDGALAFEVAERCRAAVAAIVLDGGHRVTLSAGVCDLREAPGAQGLITRADQALYRAKRYGRDMVWRHSADEGHSELRSTQSRSAIRALARAVDLKDHSTREHSDRVAELAARLAEALSWAPERVASLREAALVHDVGKIGVPDAILFKPDRLTPEEHDVVKRHAELSAQIAGEVLAAEQVAWVRGHHERVDGRGYPDGLQEEEIPEGAAILAVADAYDVMTVDRPYSAARTPLEALGELRRCAGTHFSAKVVDAFVGPRFRRYARIHENQERMRVMNDDTVVDEPVEHLQIRCECGHPTCEVALEVLRDEYRAVRTHPRRYLLADGHEIGEVEQIVARSRRYVVAQKRV